MNKSSPYTDEDLVAMFHQNELPAFKEIYRRYWYKLYLAANKRLRNREASEELVQNLFIKLWSNRERTHIKASLSAYLFIAVRYSVIDYVAKEDTQKKRLELAIFNTEATDNSMEDRMILKEMESCMARQVEKLPAKCRSVFTLSRKEYKTNREIAQLLNISEKTVENHLTNAMKVLRLSFKKLLGLAVFFFCFIGQMHSR